LIKKTNVLEKEEKELAEEEELDKFILNHLCGEIMEEVMDLGNNQVDFIESKTNQNPKRVKKAEESIFQTLYNERSFLEQ